MFKVSFSELLKKFRIEYNFSGKGWGHFVGDGKECELFIYSGRFTDEQEEMLCDALDEA